MELVRDFTTQVALHPMVASTSGRIIRLVERDYGAPLFIGTGVVVALLWSGIGPSSYQRLTSETWLQHPGALSSLNSSHQVIVNGLLTLFFLAIGLELSRELRIGTLTSPTRAVPAVVAALGGMACTALLAVLSGALTGSSALRRGWGVPMATDIAFTLGVLALGGRRLPHQLRLFLLTLAVADDAFAVVVLAFTGTTDMHVGGVVALVVTVLGARALARHTQHPLVGLALFVTIWLCFVWANIEPPLAGVVGGLAVSLGESTSLRFEQFCSRWSTGVVLPLFALVSCGVRWHALTTASGVATIVLSMIAIRIFGKVLGITGGVGLARLFGFRLDQSITWPLLVGGATLCAIGFTVPLLFAQRLFGTQSVTYSAITVGLLSSSVVAAVVGVGLLRAGTRTR